MNDATVAPKTPVSVVERVAREFSAVLLEWLGKDGLETTVENNRTQTDPLICHSHDTCDANMAMLEAFETIMEREPYMDSDEEEGLATRAHIDADWALMSSAWDMAKAAEFYINEA